MICTYSLFFSALYAKSLIIIPYYLGLYMQFSQLPTHTCPRVPCPPVSCPPVPSSAVPCLPVAYSLVPVGFLPVLLSLYWGIVICF